MLEKRCLDEGRTISYVPQGIAASHSQCESCLLCERMVHFNQESVENEAAEDVADKMKVDP